ncbi:hypothetical protein BKA93DRAFT_930133 [Sparassis latifolia]
MNPKIGPPQSTSYPSPSTMASDMANDKDKFTLNCLLERQESPIRVKATENLQVIDLQKLVWQKLANALAGVDSNKLALWKLERPIPKNEFKTFANDLPMKDIKTIAMKLGPFDRISTLFTVPPDDTCLHIVVVPADSKLHHTELIRNAGSEHRECLVEK